MLFQRDSLSEAYKNKYDKLICSRLFQIIKENKIKVVHSYIPMGSEINIYPLLEKLVSEDLKLIAPKTLKDRKLQHLHLRSLLEVEQGLFNTLHPSDSNEYKGEFDLIIVPGLAFDHLKNRLGYGGGYYDGFLALHPNALKIGLFYPFQEVSKIPTEAHDIKIDIALVIDLI